MKKWQMVVMALILVLTFSVVVLDRWLHPYDLRRELAAARAAGIATTPAEFQRKIPPPEQDAAPIWGELVRLGTPGAPRPHTEVMRLVHAAASKPFAYFPHTWEVTELFPYFEVMREGARELTAESANLVAKGKVVEAVHNQALGYRIAHQGAADPVYIGYLVSLAIDRTTTAGMMDILAKSGPRPEVSAAVRKALTANPLQDNPEQALRGEVLAIFAVSNSIHSAADFMALDGTPASSTPALARIPFPQGLWRHFVVEPNQAAFLHFMVPLIHAGQEPPAARLAAVERVTQAVNATRVYNPWYSMSHMVEGMYASAYQKHHRELAARRVLLAATRVMDYRAARGRWPARLEDAMPNPPLDPFSGKPLRYRRAGGGFVVKSVAPATGPRPRQVAFHYPAP